MKNYSPGDLEQRGQSSINPVESVISVLVKAEISIHLYIYIIQQYHTYHQSQMYLILLI